jgi:hypothetical protein
MAYDPRAVKIPKSVKRLVSNELDAHKRGALIRSYVKLLEEERLVGKNRKSKDKKEQV